MNAKSSKKRPLLLLGGAMLAGTIGAATVAIAVQSRHTAAAHDPRQDAPLVRLTAASLASEPERRFTGVIAARVQSNLGFRVSGKIVRRFVEVGEQVSSGDALLQIDDADLRLALAAKRNAVLAARAVATQARADEKRYGVLVETAVVSVQKHEQAKAALDTANAQLAAAEAAMRVAENEADYAILRADADGVIVETLAEPGQVVSTGQPVMRLAHSGRREAVVALPEGVRPEIGATADAVIYGQGQQASKARLRQLSNAADPQTRTYEARYVLEGAAASAPLGSTVTITQFRAAATELQLPVGAILNDGKTTGVWLYDSADSIVRFKAIDLKRVSGEFAIVSGLDPDEPVVSIGAHLLWNGARVRTSADVGAAK